MRIDRPTPDSVPALRRLWKAAFGDGDEFLDCFFTTAFSPDRCRCLWLEDRLAAGLYWFDISCRGKPMAYLYAVATAPEFRNRGLCRRLMADTHRHLSARGYAGAVLVPEGEALFRMYAGMGYRCCGTVSEFTCAAGDPVSLRSIRREEYARLRRQYLPRGGVVQEEENLTFLERQASFYTGPDFLLTARQEDGALVGLELLGNPAAAPGILGTLGLSQGRFRSPGDGKPFAMFLPLEDDAESPAYFGLAFD